MKKLDESNIPKGVYCYDTNGLCPHFSHIEDKKIKIPYCKFLKLGDVGDLNCDDFNILVKKYGTEKKVYKKYPLVFLWDQCKECGINID